MNDWQLLARYRNDGSQAAFTILVERHLPMVYAVCRRDLGDATLAEDAAQVAFMVLARKARALRPTGSLASWLFATARLAARDLRKQEARRRLREEHMRQSMTAAEGLDPWSEMEPVIDDALARLSADERTVILLRYFEGHSPKEIAEMLGISVSAAEKRGLRAIDRLRRTLAAQGVAVTATALAPCLTDHAASAAPLTAPAVAGAACGAVAAPPLAVVTEGVLHTMQLMRVKAIAAVAATVAVGGFVGGPAIRAVGIRTTGIRAIAQQAVPGRLPANVHFMQPSDWLARSTILLDTDGDTTTLCFYESIGSQPTIWKGKVADLPRHMTMTNTDNTMTLADDAGKLHWSKVYEQPELTFRAVADGSGTLTDSSGRALWSGVLSLHPDGQQTIDQLQSCQPRGGAAKMAMPAFVSCGGGQMVMVSYAVTLDGKLLLTDEKGKTLWTGVPARNLGVRFVGVNDGVVYGIQTDMHWPNRKITFDLKVEPCTMTYEDLISGETGAIPVWITQITRSFADGKSGSDDTELAPQESVDPLQARTNHDMRLKLRLGPVWGKIEFPMKPGADVRLTYRDASGKVVHVRRLTVGKVTTNIIKRPGGLRDEGEVTIHEYDGQGNETAVYKDLGRTYAEPRNHYHI
jgi:RNA polymerase sigma factor (sigma-70 family)